MLSPVARIRDLLARFCRSRDGNVMMLFGLSIIPVIGMMGAAADYARSATARTEMQVALDATTLMLSKQVNSLTPAQVSTNAQTYFKSMFTRTDVSNLVVTASYTTSGGFKLNTNVTGKVTTNFTGVLGIHSMTIGATSQAVWGNTRLRVALVLDNTGSMASNGKMTALKTATTNLLSQLQAAVTTAGDVYVSIIPFTIDVNVGSGNLGANWLKWDAWDAANGTCTNSSYNASTSAFDARNSGDGQAPCVASKATWKSNKCSNPVYTTKSACTAGYNAWTPAAHSSANWTGCVTDRDQSYDTTATTPSTANKATLFPIDGNDGYCPVQLMAQSNDWTALNSKVTSMVANGGTNQTVGLQWGMQSLIGGGPLAIPAQDTNYQYSNIIILLTDGLNTADRWYGNGSDTSSQVDTRMALACSAAKTAGITVYTVQVDINGSDGQSSILPACASSADKFTYLTNSSQIITTFGQIGAKLTALRLAK